MVPLIEAPEIPNTVTNMYGTFSGCANLVKAPIIPQNVSAMEKIFSGCNSLTGSLIINASPNYYMSSLYNVATNEGCELILSGSSTKLNEILTTKSANSNIRIGN